MFRDCPAHLGSPVMGRLWGWSYFAAVALVFVAVIAIVIFATSGHTG